MKQLAQIWVRLYKGKVTNTWYKLYKYNIKDMVNNYDNFDVSDNNCIQSTMSYFG